MPQPRFGVHKEGDVRAHPMRTPAYPSQHLLTPPALSPGTKSEAKGQPSPGGEAGEAQPRAEPRSPTQQTARGHELL